MNEFTAKKLGEVLAFSDVALDTINKVRGIINSAFGEENVQNYEIQMKTQKDIIHNLANRAKQLAKVIEQFEESKKKLEDMRNEYIGDEWNNPVEFLEWSGFFEGAAIVHWSLVQGAAKAIAHSEMEALATQALESHKEMFEVAAKKLKEIGLQNSNS